MWARKSYSDDSRNSFSSGGGSPRGRRLVIGPIIIALLFIAFQYFSSETYVNPETGKAARVALSAEQEDRLGLQSFQEILSQSESITGGADYDTVRRVVANLIKHVDDNSKQFNWAVSLLRSEQANAFCLPGGKIAVYTGIIPITQNDSGLAAVLGHEIAHATARHGAQRLFQQTLVQTAIQGVGGSMMEMDPRERQMVMGLLGAGVQYGLILPYSRDHELEADAVGLKYMIRAGYDPEEAIRFWQRMGESSKGQPPEWASTHPSHGSRIARIRELIDEMSDSKS